jgi:hypothetical protein
VIKKVKNPQVYTHLSTPEAAAYFQVQGVRGQRKQTWLFLAEGFGHDTGIILRPRPPMGHSGAILLGAIEAIGFQSRA